MHYLDPSRPRLHGTNGLPLFQGAHRGRIAIPGLYVAPRGTPDDPKLEISVFLPMPSGGSARREITIDPETFPAFWTRWLENPEEVAKSDFNWAPSSAPELDLDDLLKGF
jgi:hypothetical protein